MRKKPKIFFAFSNESTFGEANVSENLEQNKIILIIFYAEMHLSFVSLHISCNVHDNPSVRDEMKWAVVMDFTDDMNGGIASIGRNMDCSYGLVRMFDGYFRRTNLRLLPPKEGQTVAVGVFRLGSIKTNGVTSLYKNMDRLTTLMTTNDNLRIMVALALLGPLHTSHEVVELVRIETLLIANDAKEVCQHEV